MFVSLSATTRRTNLVFVALGAGESASPEGWELAASRQRAAGWQLLLEHCLAQLCARPHGESSARGATLGAGRERAELARGAARHGVCLVRDDSDDLCARELRRCARAHRSQAGRWYSKADRGGTEIEVDVLALLVARFEADGTALMWSTDVLGDVDDYTDGEPWSPPTSWRRERQRLSDLFVGTFLRRITPEDAQAIAAAIRGMRPDVVHRPSGEHDIRQYIKEFTSPAPQALLGQGGGATYKKGAPLRRIYLMPRVARLVRDGLDELVAKLDSGREEAIKRSVERDRRIKVPSSANKADVKDELEQLYERIAVDERSYMEEATAVYARIARLTRERTAARAELKHDMTRRTAAAHVSAADEARAQMNAIKSERDAALASARKAEAENRDLRRDLSRARARASDPAALRRKAAEIAELRSENAVLVRDKKTLEEELATARADAAKVRLEYSEVRVPRRASGNGAGRGRPWAEWFRRTYGKLMTEGQVSASKLNTVWTICAEAICLRKCEREMELPDDKFGQELRTEMGAVHACCAGLALARAERVASSQTDESPLDQREYAVMPMQIEIADADGGSRLERWSGTGAYENSHFTGKAQAIAVKEKVFGRLGDAHFAVQAALEKKYGPEKAKQIIDARAGGVTMRKLVGSVVATDNASAALTCQKELMALVETEVKNNMGDEEWAKLSTEQQQKLTRVWCVVFRLLWRAAALPTAASAEATPTSAGPAAASSASSRV